MQITTAIKQSILYLLLIIFVIICNFELNVIFIIVLIVFVLYANYMQIGKLLISPFSGY